MSLQNNIIEEGGHAIQNVDRIPRELIPLTLERVKNEIIFKAFPTLSHDAVFVTGSTGKKPDSGDIDVCVDIRSLNGSALTNLMLLNQFCGKNLDIPGYINTFTLDQLHIRFPQGDTDKYVQVDIMLTKNPDFVKFFACGDVEHTKYKLAHRNVLFDAILFAISSVVEQEDENGLPLTWGTLKMASSGIFKIWCSLLDEAGKRLTWDGKEIYHGGYVRIIQRNLYMNSPELAIDLMFGPKVTKEQLGNFEQVFNLILSPEFKFHKMHKKILWWAYVLLNGNEKLDMPEELLHYVEI